MALIKRSNTKSTAMKYRPIDTNSARSMAKGTKPLAEAATIQHVLLMMVVHLCRKIMYGVDISMRVGLYMLGTLVISVIGDFSTENSTSYFAQQNNSLNIYFVKWGWGWTLIFVGLFVGLTSFTTSCGSKSVLKNQAFRLIVATCVWFVWTSFFEVIEHRSGICSVTKYLAKKNCLAKGYKWRGFDISGHCFLLIWNNLFILEEAKAYTGWERIKDMLRNEEHKRLDVNLNASGDNGGTELSKLKNEEFLHLRANYKSLTPWVRFLFCVLSIWVVLWDVMLFATTLYFHITLEKIIAASIAICTWYLLYRVIYTKSWSPGLPGEGVFKYVPDKRSMKRNDSLRARYQDNGGQKWSAKDDIPMFMGMPVYSAMKKDDLNAVDNQEDDFKSNVRNARKASIDASTYSLNQRSRSRSASRNRMNSVSRSSLNLKLW